MSIKYNIETIQNNLKPNVTLVAVSKTRSIEEINEAYLEGIRDFGENKVQEIVSKYEELPKDIKWHLIGHLQRNKVKYIVDKVHLIHSLDSIELLKEIEKRYKEKDKIANVLIQINIGREGTKSGVSIEDLQELVNTCKQCSSVYVKGLMAILPVGDEKTCAYYFTKMKEIYDDLSTLENSNISMEILSMGMSGDYKVAVENGSNMVRIGEGIFGKRIYNNK